MSLHTFFTIYIKCTAINGEFWIPYGGPHWWGYDWWNVPSAKFASEESAMNAIKSDRNFKNCRWEIVKTTVTEETVKERSV